LTLRERIEDKVFILGHTTHFTAIIKLVTVIDFGIDGKKKHCAKGDAGPNVGGKYLYNVYLGY
jgi:hypothetical protein